MHSQRVHTVADRIVSISQPHAPSSGASRQASGFGASFSISYQSEGYVSVDKLSWDAYNESADLPAQIETYKERFGYYPSASMQYHLSHPREQKYCKDRGIR